MKSLDLDHIERELRKRNQYPYQWFRKQNDEWDDYSNFVYKIPNWEELIQKIEAVAQKKQLNKQQIFQYAANRWYNFWSAKAVEQIFIGMEGVSAVSKAKDSEKDFYIFGIPFDHKTTVFPKQFGRSFDYAHSHKAELIEWLYKNQSSQKRYHLKNRIFIVIYDQVGQHWKMKADISLLQKSIEGYVCGFTKERLISLTFASEKMALSDIIWVTK